MYCNGDMKYVCSWHLAGTAAELGLSARHGMNAQLVSRDLLHQTNSRSRYTDTTETHSVPAIIPRHYSVTLTVTPVVVLAVAGHLGHSKNTD